MSIKLMVDQRENNKHEIAYNQIKNLIIKNRIEPNTLLVERQLSEQLGVSRTPIREALKRLTSEGLTEFIPGKGVFVSNLTFEDFINISEVREALEGMAAKLCTLKKDEKVIETLEKNLDALEEALNSGDYDQSVEYDIQFHHILISGAKNPKLENLLNGIYDQINRFAFFSVSDVERQRMSLRQHRKVLEAIKNDDANLAEKLIRDHIIHVKEYHVKKVFLY